MTTALIISITAVILIITILVWYKYKKIKKQNVYINPRMVERDNDGDQSISPIQIIVKNSSANIETVTLFSKNKVSNIKNNGNSDFISINCATEEQEYSQLLNQISDNNIKACLFRVQSTNTGQITQVMNLTSYDANGAKISLPLITQSYFSANQFQSGILDIPFVLVIDNDFEIKVNVLANTSFVLSIFPSKRNCEKSSFISLLETISLSFGYNIVKKQALDYYFPSVPVAAHPVYISSKFRNKKTLKTIWNKIINFFKIKREDIS